MPSIKKNIDLYTHLVNKYGIDYRSLNWGSEESQQKRFEVLSQIGDLKGKSILDVGCGIGDYYNWLQNKNIYAHYHGLDITPAMIDAAKHRFPTVDFYTGSIDQLTQEKIFDYIMASGIFTYMEEKDMFLTISDMFKRSRLGIAFNGLCAWADQQDDGELYSDPFKVMEFCKSLSKKMVFRNDYHSADYTIYLYK